MKWVGDAPDIVDLANVSNDGALSGVSRIDDGGVRVVRRGYTQEPDAANERLVGGRIVIVAHKAGKLDAVQRRVARSRGPWRRGGVELDLVICRLFHRSADRVLDHSVYHALRKLPLQFSAHHASDFTHRGLCIGERVFGSLLTEPHRLLQCFLPQLGAFAERLAEFLAQSHCR